VALRTLNCPKCFSLLPERLLNLPEFESCPNCRTSIQAEVFPSLFRPIEKGPAGEAILTDQEASCFHHPEKRAVVVCTACGRFLCSLCDCELHGLHYCPGCLETGKTKGKIKSLQTGRTRYDSIALALALYPILTVYFTLICAPIALFLVVRHWNTPRGPTNPTRARLITAGVIALLELAAWTIFFIVLATH
jgi:hypothetical protein